MVLGTSSRPGVWLDSLELVMVKKSLEFLPRSFVLLEYFLLRSPFPYLPAIAVELDLNSSIGASKISDFCCYRI